MVLFLITELMAVGFQQLQKSAARLAAEAWDDCLPAPQETLSAILSSNNPCAIPDKPLAQVVNDPKALYQIFSSLFEYLRIEDLEHWDENGREPDGAVALFTALVPHSSGLD